MRILIVIFLFVLTFSNSEFAYAADGFKLDLAVTRDLTHAKKYERIYHTYSDGKGNYYTSSREQTAGVFSDYVIATSHGKIKWKVKMFTMSPSGNSYATREGSYLCGMTKTGDPYMYHIDQKNTFTLFVLDQRSGVRTQVFSKTMQGSENFGQSFDKYHNFFIVFYRIGHGGEVYKITDKTVNWKVTTPFPDWDPVSSKDGYGYILDHKQGIVAIDPSGNKAWELQGGVDNNPKDEFRWVGATDAGTVVGITGTSVVGLASNGTEKWRYSGTDSELSHFISAQIDASGMIYIKTRSKLIAMSEDGTKKWEYEEVLKGEYPWYYNQYMILSNKLILIQFDKDRTNTIIAIDYQGKLKWKKDIPYTGGLVEHNGTLFFGLFFEKKVMAMDLNGKTLWTKKGEIVETHETNELYYHPNGYVNDFHPHKAVVYKIN